MIQKNRVFLIKMYHLDALLPTPKKTAKLTMA